MSTIAPAPMVASCSAAEAMLQPYHSSTFTFMYSATTKKVCCACTTIACKAVDGAVTFWTWVVWTTEA